MSYFNGKPLKGKQEFKSIFKGVGYLFATREHLNIFEKSPEKYEPQFGGWCAYAVGNSSEKVKIDPQTYTIIKGKLYLFYNFFFTNTLELWKENKNELLKNLI